MLATREQSAELIKIFHQKGRQQLYKKGEFIIRPGETPVGVFFIAKGLVKAYDVTKYGEENLLSVRKEREIFPLIWGLTGQERSIIYEALETTTLLRISREEFMDYLFSHKGATLSILDLTVEMYRLHSERILNLEHRSIRQRLISFLLTMADHFGVDQKGGRMINVPLKHQDIASSISTRRETVSRLLAVLEQKQLVANHRSRILLKDVEALRRYLS